MSSTKCTSPAELYLSVALALLVSAVVDSGLIASGEVPPKSQSPSGSQPSKPPGVPQAERPPVWQFPVPHPGSTSPTEVVENIKAVIQQTTFGDNIPELTSGNFQALRILHVKSELTPSEYLVAELANNDGVLIAAFGITRSGQPLGVVDHRGLSIPKSLDLPDAAARVRKRLGHSPQSTEYVYFHNVAEYGFSMFRPLVAVKTPRGTVYLNSQGEAFVEDKTPLAAELRGATPTSPRGFPKPLRSVGRW